MTTLLSIRTSLAGPAAASSRLAEHFEKQWLARNAAGRIVTRDLAADPVPHLTMERLLAFSTPQEKRTSEQQAVVDYSDRLIAELRSADVIALAVPMYNFSIPSTLRAYFDHIARAGVTFRYTANGPEGLLKGKQTYVFIARGGAYSPEQDTQTPYLRQFLSFVGLNDTRFVHAERLALGEQVRGASLSAAMAAIEALKPLEQAA